MIYSLCCLTAVPQLRAQTPTTTVAQLMLGRSLFEQGKYQATAKHFQHLLDTYQLRRATEITEAHSYLGACYFYLDQLHKAREHFQSLLHFQPDAELDGQRFSPKVQQFLNTVKPDHLISKANGNPNVLTPLIVKETPPNLQQQFSLHEATPPPAAYSYLPFGVGQFANGERGKGIFFLSTQSLFLAGALAAVALYEGQRDNQGGFTDPQAASLYRTLFGASLLSFGSIAGIGIFDAVLVRQRQKNRTPAGPASDGTGGIRLGALP